MTAQAGQADGSGQLTRSQIDDQQAAGGRRLDGADPVLRMLAKAMALQQADHGQWQQDDQRQIARLDEAGPNGGQYLVQRKARRKGSAYGGHDDHQHGVKAQRKARNDDEHANQRPQVEIYRHQASGESRPYPLRGGL
jgi:hypothetical protein